MKLVLNLKKNRIQDLSHHNYKESIAVRDFLDLVDYINNQNDIILLKGKYDALQILDNYSLIIAMPITTPLVIAKMAGKDCLVHDPYSYENLPETTFEQIKEYDIPILYD